MDLGIWRDFFDANEGNWQIQEILKRVSTMNVRDKMHLKEVLLQEKKMYLEQVGNYQKRLKIWKSHPDYFAWKYVRRMRITSYYYSRRKQNPMCSLFI